MTAQQGSLINQDLKPIVEVQENDKQPECDGHVLDPITSVQISISVEEYNAHHPENPIDDMKVKELFTKYGLTVERICKFTGEEFVILIKEVSPCLSMKIWRDLAVLKEPRNSFPGQYTYIDADNQQAQIYIANIGMMEEKNRKLRQMVAWQSNKLQELAQHEC
eukprot:837338_1